MQAVRSLLFFCAIALSSFSVQATQQTASTQDPVHFTAALNLFQQEQHAEAYAAMQRLMPLGSMDAAYLIGMMYIQELGVEYNPVASLAYLHSAERWGDTRAPHMIAQIKPHLSAAEQNQATHLSNQHEQQLVVAFGEHTMPGARASREAVRRAMPQYPAEHARASNHGWIDLILGIDSRGRIFAVQPLNNADRSFVRAFNRVAGSWRYEPSDGVSLQTMRLTYTVDGNPSDDAILEDIKREYESNANLANAGLQQNQLYLAGLTQLWITTDSAAADTLLPASVWYERSARNGSVLAQRYLAIHEAHIGWAEYLIQQNDVDVMVWHGARLVTESNDPVEQARGKQLIDDAGRAGNRMARDFLRFM